MDQILNEWTGNESVNPNSRGPYVNSQELAVVEHFMGTAWYKFEIATNIIPGGQAGDVLGKVYDKIKESMYVDLMRQSHLQTIYGLIDFRVDITNRCLRADISAAKLALETELTIDPVQGKAQTVEFFRMIDSLGVVCVIDDLSSVQESISVLYPEMEEDIYAGLGKCIVGTNGNDLLLADREHIRVVGKTGNDTIFGNNSKLFDDVLCGGAGNDDIYGLDGDDIISGGAGNDDLTGGTGSDTYIYGIGSGNDVITNGDTDNSGSQDTVKLSASITPDMVEFRYDLEHNGDARYWHDIQLRIKSTGEILRIRNWFMSEGNQIERFIFADGSVITAAEINASIQFNGTDNGENMFGSGFFGDRMNGLGGNDGLYGLGGNDQILEVMELMIFTGRRE